MVAEYASHTDDFAGDVDDLEALEQMTPVVVQSCPVDAGLLSITC